MIWTTATLLNEQETGKDELGNAVMEYVDVKTVEMRFTPWSNEERQLEGREVTENTQKYLIPSAAFSACSAVRVDGVVRKLKKAVNLSPRWVCLVIENYKQSLTEGANEG